MLNSSQKQMNTKLQRSAVLVKVETTQYNYLLVFYISIMQAHTLNLELSRVDS